MKKRPLKLYAVVGIYEDDQNKYKALSLRDNLDFLKATASGGDSHVFLEKYRPPEVFWAESDSENELADNIPCTAFNLTLTRKAYLILEPYLNANGVIVEVPFGGDVFYGYKTWKEYPDLISHKQGAEFVFNKNKKTHLFVSEEVKNLIEREGLTGFQFQKRN
ncbi:hypothetical protein [Methylotenera sp.]|uniref:hypothetical protein n=1 Tax=Methylotenera sp. TaxID=2051956 RepID=UPI0025F0C685|nr:hypothetical protein [Methylotenera sp.]